MVRTIALVLVIVAAAAASAVGYALHNWNAPLNVPLNGTVVEVYSGDALSTVLRRLSKQGVIPRPRWVAQVARWYGLDGRLQVGEYQLNSGMTASDLLTQFAAGQVITYSVTLPEGITLQRALEILAEHSAIERSLEGAGDPRLLAMVAPATHPEGWFLPETYVFHRGESDVALLQRAHDAMTTLLNRLWLARREGLPLQTSYEALILASIIERETGLAKERRQIAGVFIRRLLRGMRLQTDPTIIYGLGPAFDGDLKRRHLKDDTNPYNTYRIPGLPPTPIALPGEDAIKAALDPAEGDALFFVARGDGSHAFADTLEAHESNVRQYQINRRKDYRSSPTQ
ncbi:conserved hypothetical protein [Luminiphilus syltensis NOR5-1B]|uniref:Endolytic murein transglycosylase n=1 Tax=Luminiphilus syltensis NOR5-1B TaxID=565045 RepID=B8KQW5_9GAMM|nr:endolytic transglycosylase MltG [Luminiphilus syltensis]EED35489.1 conserved hypothetical protein [Luminiphilus syltensis NOR5-1B]